MDGLGYGGGGLGMVSLRASVCQNNRPHTCERVSRYILPYQRCATDAEIKNTYIGPRYDGASDLLR